jgi:hypothetical protein
MSKLYNSKHQKHSGYGVLLLVLVVLEPMHAVSSSVQRQRTLLLLQLYPFLNLRMHKLQSSELIYAGGKHGNLQGICLVDGHSLSI